jgi:phosphomannomutase
MTAPQDVLAQAQAWAAADPDSITSAELLRLVEAGATAELADRMAGRLEFGTAGLRGVIGAGPNRMNRAVVIQTTFGLGSWLAKLPDGAKRGVVVGFDGRRMSREFADDVGAVLAAAGIRVFVFTELVPTPLVGFAAAKLGAAAGVMITASHNPPEYNGYKVYGPAAAQIVPPADSEIAAEIARAPDASKVARISAEEARARGLREDVPDTIVRDYLDRVRALVGDDGKSARAGLRIVYTPLHGVGGRISMAAFAQNGFTSVSPVAEQFEPDGAFPTVAFPNPEEKGAMDLALALARKERADLVIANDPDADRLAVAVPRGDGQYMQLTGNQVGVLLGHHLLTKSGPPDPKKLVITTIVSSPMLGAIASALGAFYEETLTGFKWIASRAIELKEERGLDFVFGYEEALGYTISTLVRDKDGVSAALVFAGLVASLRERGSDVLGELEALSRKYGLFVSEQVSVTKKGSDGSQAIKALMTKLRTEPPPAIGSLDVLAVRDYLTKTRTERASLMASPLTLPASDVVAFELEGGSRVIARPSGTEPKIKFYFDVREPMAESEPIAAARARAEAVLASLKKDFLSRYVD